MATIRIIRTPWGDAPDWVREAWIGLDLPVAVDIPENPRMATVQTNSPLPQPRVATASVYFDQAIAALEPGHPDAANWWRELACRRPGLDWLTFDSASYEYISDEQPTF